MKVIKKNNKGGILVYTTQDDNTPFVTSGQGLYAWAFESRYKTFTGTEDDVLKFGQYGTDAKGGSTPQDTILSYSGTTTEPIVILWAKRFSDDEIKVGTAKRIERIVNKKIGPRYKDAKSTETFYTTVDIIKRVVNETLYNSVRLDSYSLRGNQQPAVDKMVSYFKAGGTDFLLDAIMRYGKNFVFLNTCKRVIDKSGNILVLTNKPGVFSSIINDVSNHVLFEDFNIVVLKDIKDKNNLQLDNNKINIVLCSKQLADNIISGKKTRVFLSNQKWDLSFFDECHSGTDTKNFEELNNMLSIKHRVWASGTAQKITATGGFTKSNSFVYDYIDQQRDKKAGICPDAVTINTYGIEVNPNNTTNPNYTVEESHTLTKQFAFENDKFVFGGEVRDLIKDILGKSDTKSKYSPMRICEGKLNHTVWLLPQNVNMISALAKMIKEIAPEYEVLNASGNNVKNIDEVHDTIKRHDKTITLTCDRFKEGTTVPEWTGAFVLTDTESVEFYFQFIFRVGTPNKGKDTAYVFDFNPERTFNMMFEVSNSRAINTDNDDVQEVMREYLDNMPVFRNQGVSFKQVKVEDILHQIKTSDYRRSSLLKNANEYVNPENINEGTIGDFDHITACNKTSITTKMIENGLSKGKNYSQQGRANNPNTEEVNELLESVKKISTIVARLPILSTLSGSTTVGSLLDDTSDNIIEEVTGINKNIFYKLISNDIIDTRVINRYL